MPFKYEREKREELITFMTTFFKNNPRFVNLCEGSTDREIYREYCEMVKAQYLEEFPRGAGYDLHRHFGLVSNLPYKIKSIDGKLEDNLRGFLISKRNQKEIC